MNHPYRLEKSVWTSDDFAVMGWHESCVWAMVASEEDVEFVVDLDSIFRWVLPDFAR